MIFLSWDKKAQDITKTVEVSIRPETRSVRNELLNFEGLLRSWEQAGSSIRRVDLPLHDHGNCSEPIISEMIIISIGMFLRHIIWNMEFYYYGYKLINKPKNTLNL